MAKYDLKFISNDDDFATISVKSEKNQIVITTEVVYSESISICLDKSTAIKFSKTLRTEINKISESDVNNG